MDILPSVPPRSADPHLRERIINTAAQLLASEGAVSARRLARELGTSTMVVYTHFGGMDELTREVMRRGFADFGTELDRGAVTDDAVADWMTYLWSYRRFALREPHLYGVMFGPGLAAFRLGDPADLEAARSTFVSLLRRIHACVNAARWEVRRRHHRRRSCLVRCARPHHARAHRVLRFGRPRPSALVQRDPHQDVDRPRRRRPSHRSLAVDRQTAGRPRRPSPGRVCTMSVAVTHGRPPPGIARYRIVDRRRRFLRRQTCTAR